jgi:hypothetical protein
MKRVAYFVRLTMILVVAIILGLLNVNALAQTPAPPQIVFFDEAVMSEKRALELAEFTRSRFWGRVSGFNGKTLMEPRDEAERSSIPIPRWHVLYIASFARSDAASISIANTF